jgi:hypothetical protein
MKKLVVQYSGWFEIPLEEVNLVDLNSADMETKTALEWLIEHGNIDGLALEDFNTALMASSDGELKEMNLEIEEEESELLEIHYRCPFCFHEWTERYSCACDSECPKCGAGDITALSWEEVE